MNLYIYPSEKMSNKTAKGFTLSELLLASAILAFALSGILLLFINCILLNEVSRNTTLAYSAVQAKMEEVKNTSFGTMDSLNNTVFSLNGFLPGDASATISVTAVSGGSTRIRQVSIVACFRARNRIIGDSLVNCQISPVMLDTLIAE